MFAAGIFDIVIVLKCDIKLLRHKVHGKSIQRIERLWTSNCCCGKGCYHSLKEFHADFSEFLATFWGLGKLQQDVYVRTLHTDLGSL